MPVSQAKKKVAMTIFLLSYESFQGLLKYAIKSILTKMTKSDLMKIAAVLSRLH